MCKSTSNTHPTKTSSQEGRPPGNFPAPGEARSKSSLKMGVNSSGSDSEPEEYGILGHDWDGVGYGENGDVFSW